MSAAFLSKVSRKGSNKEKLALEVAHEPELVAMLFEGLRADKAAVKFGCAKILQILSVTTPELIYPRFDAFVEMLDSDNSILKWGAILMLANLTRVDTESKFERIFAHYFAPIGGPQMITAANTIRSVPVIALSKPQLIDRMTAEILKAEKADFETKECVNIACGHAMDVFSQIFEKIDNKKPVLAFVTRQLKSTRPAVRKRAEKFLKKNAK